MNSQLFAGSWAPFQFRNPIHSQQVSLDGGSAGRKGSPYASLHGVATQNTSRIMLMSVLFMGIKHLPKFLARTCIDAVTYWPQGKKYGVATLPLLGIGP
jgi:hypothetical protein